MSFTLSDEDAGVAEQIEVCAKIKRDIRDILEEVYLSNKSSIIIPQEILHILSFLNFSDVSYELNFEEIGFNDANRLESILSGPLYCSEAYPQMRDRDGKSMLPILQLNLGLIGARCGHEFPNSILQLWLSRNWRHHQLRLIPWDHASSHRPSDFDYSDLLGNGDNRSCDNWPWYGPTQKLTELIRVGVTCPKVAYILDAGEMVLPERLVDLLTELECASSSVGTHLFGRFYDPNYYFIEMKEYKLLITINDWMSCGYAHIFYKTDVSGGMEFKFFHTPR